MDLPGSLPPPMPPSPPPVWPGGPKRKATKYVQITDDIRVTETGYECVAEMQNQSSCIVYCVDYWEIDGDPDTTFVGQTISGLIRAGAIEEVEHGVFDLVDAIRDPLSEMIYCQALGDAHREEGTL